MNISRIQFPQEDDGTGSATATVHRAGGDCQGVRLESILGHRVRLRGRVWPKPPKATRPPRQTERNKTTIAHRYMSDTSNKNEVPLILF
jgi:hypothetical protein